MKRLFIGTNISLSPQFLEIQKKLENVTFADKITWVKDDVRHLTLRFIGKTPDIKIPSIENGLEAVFTRFPQFDLTLDKIGIFGCRHHPEVVWLGFEQFDTLRQLFLQVEPMITELGFEPYNGNFVPHVTLGRIRKLNSTRFFWQQFEKISVTCKQTITISSFSLIQSRLNSDGPSYTTLKTWQLSC